MRYSENTDYYKARILKNLPAYYVQEDATGDFDRLITIMAELLACGALSLKDLMAQMHIARSKNDFLASFAENFGLWIDPEYIENQKAFVALAARWIDRKGVKTGIQSLIASFNQDARIDEVRVIYPVCGESYGHLLTCGMSGLKCNMPLQVPFGSVLYEFSQIGNIINIEISNYDESNVKLTNAMRKGLDFLIPIHIVVQDFVDNSHDELEDDYLYLI